MQGIEEKAEFLGALAAGWREAGRLDVVLLRALSDLAARSHQDSEVGFDPWDVADEMGRILGRKWGAADSRETIAGKVREHWQRLASETWPRKCEGIRQAFAKKGFDTVPELDRIEGGGQGNPTRYRLNWVSVQQENGAPRQDHEVRDAAPEDDRRADPAPASIAQVEYICEDVEDASWLARAFAEGFRLVGWRRRVLQVLFIGGLLIVALSIMLVALTMVGKRSLADSAYAAIGAGVFAYGFWSTLGHLLMLHSWRIALAPWWMQSVDDDRLIEWRCPPRFADKSIKAVRYTATCPLCGGRVIARSGGLRHAWALMGRCEEAPAAHVFTFDHVLREGRLRQ